MSDLAEKPWRMFIAVEVRAMVRRSLIAHINHLRQAFPEVRASWSREENLHLTLKFLGDVPVTKIEDLARATERAARSVSPFEFAINCCGVFPPKGPPRVLWIGVEDQSGTLTQLQRAIEDECAASDFERDTRAFHPHLTIARLREPDAARQLAMQHREARIGENLVRVSELAVVRSELRTEGSRHTTVARHRLGY